MNRKTSVELTNMCMIYDGRGNVLVEEKLVHNIKGLISIIQSDQAGTGLSYAYGNTE